MALPTAAGDVLVYPEEAEAAKSCGMEIRPSQIPGAGLGLYALRRFAPHKRIAEYTGDWVLATAKNENVLFPYGVGMCKKGNKEYIIDAARRPRCPAGFANDANGPGRNANFRNNAIMRMSARSDRIYVHSTRTIRPGDEIFLTYGHEYWDVPYKKYRARPKTATAAPPEPVMPADQ